jgi:hypothetical protein
MLTGIFQTARILLGRMKAVKQSDLVAWRKAKRRKL